MDEGVVIFGAGSPIVVDVEESLARAGLTVAAAVENMDCESWVLDRSKLVRSDSLTDDIKGLPFLVPLFAPANRQSAAREAAELGFDKPFTLIDPSVALPRSFEAGPGTYVNAGCSLGGAGRCGAFVFVNRGASIGHHVQLGRFVSVGPGAVLAGRVNAGAGAFIGAGAVVLSKIRIGANAVVGAGAVVTADVPDHCLAVGCPARVIKTGIAGYGDRAVD